MLEYMHNIKKGGMKVSKKDKQFYKLLHKKTLSSDEAVRLCEIDGWYDDPYHPFDGSHKHMVHSTKSGKVTIPMGRDCLKKKTHDSILKDAGLIGD